MNFASVMAIIPHLLRPWWLLALSALPLLWWLRRRRAKTDTPWRQAVDPHLLPSLLQAAPASAQRVAWLFGAVYALSVLALAGPSWRQLPVPLYAPAAPLVVAMDLSSHMLVADLRPSRLLRARLKIEQLIAQRKGGQLGLVAYAGDAFTVAPLSDDANNMRDLLAALAPDTMPVDGQRADLAIRRAADLLVHAGYAHGQILLLSDGADALLAQTAARDALGKGFRVDVLGVGTTQGAPVPSLDGAFAQDVNGTLQIARLDSDALRALSRSGGGRYAALSADANDLKTLGVLESEPDAAVHRSDTESLRWRDDGALLLLALLPLVALGFRRGWLAVVLLAALAMPTQRAAATDASWWNALWQRADQRADRALRSGDSKNASLLAQTPEQRAAAAYRTGNFAVAAQTWARRGNADAHYNRGNALAQMKQYPQAIDAYKRALQLSPGMADAQANLKLIEQLQRQQQQQQQQDGQQKNQDRQAQNQQQQKQDQQKQDQQKQDQQKQDQRKQAQQKQDQQKQDQNGQNKNQENMQSSQQQAQQQKQNSQQQNSQQNRPQQNDLQQSRQGNEQQQAQQQQPKPDPKQQAQADAAEQRALQQALRNRKPDDGKPRQPVAIAKETTAKREQREAIESLLQRIPDDPGGLLRRKFALEYARHQQEGDK